MMVATYLTSSTTASLVAKYGNKKIIHCEVNKIELKMSTNILIGDLFTPSPIINGREPLCDL